MEKSGGLTHLLKVVELLQVLPVICVSAVCKHDYLCPPCPFRQLYCVYQLHCVWVHPLAARALLADMYKLGQNTNTALKSTELGYRVSPNVIVP